MTTETVFLLQPNVGRAGKWIELVDNNNGANVVFSTGPTSATGKAQIASPAPGDYSLYMADTLLPANDAGWLLQEEHHLVPNVSAAASLDTVASDIQPVAGSPAAGARGLGADAGHQHVGVHSLAVDGIQLLNAGSGLDATLSIKTLPDYFRATARLAETHSRKQGFTVGASPENSGQLCLTAILLWPGMGPINTIEYYSGTQAYVAGSGENKWFALFDNALAKLGVTADDTNTAWTANSAKSLALSAPYTPTYVGIYYVGIMIKTTGGTLPNLISSVGSIGFNGLAPVTVANDTTHTGLTNPASCPATAALTTIIANAPYASVY